MTIAVSIIVPVYNVDKYLYKCLQSIKDQVLQNIEVIIINDGSTDESKEIADSFCKNDFRFKLFNQENGGYGKALNYGIKIASGDYIGIVESDDFISSKMFEELYNSAIKNNADVVKSNFNYYWSIPKDKFKFCEILPNKYNRVINPREDLSIFWSMPCIWAAIYKTSFIRKNKINFLETAGASYQDTSFNFKIWAMARRVVFIKDAFLNYRQDNENSSVKSNKKIFCVCDEFYEIYKYSFVNCPRNILKLIPCIQLGTYKWNLTRLSMFDRFKFIKKMQQEYDMYRKQNILDYSFFSKKDRIRINILLKSRYIYFFLNFMEYIWKK